MKKTINRVNFIVMSIVSILILVFLLGVKESYAAGAPKIIISSYEIVEGRAAAGESFKVKFKITNRSSVYDADSILITFNNEANQILPVQGGTNQAYIDFLGKESSVDVEFTMKVDSAVIVDTIPINFYMEYAFSEGSIVENNVECSLDLQPSCKLNIITLSVSDVAYKDGNTYISFYGKNTGNVNIKNLTMNIKGKIDSNDSQFNIGSIPNGSAKNQDFCVAVKGKGKQQIGISFTYQDELGNQYVVDERTYEVDVTDKEGLGKSKVSLLTAIKNATWQIYAIAIAMVAIGFLIVVYKRIKRYA